MPQVHFTPQLAKFVESGASEAPGGTVGAALEAVFRGNEQLRGYVLDDQGQLRRHVMVFVDGETIMDRVGLSDPVREGSEIYVMQALSGG